MIEKILNGKSIVLVYIIIITLLYFGVVISLNNSAKYSNKYENIEQSLTYLNN